MKKNCLEASFLLLSIFVSAGVPNKRFLFLFFSGKEKRCTKLLPLREGGSRQRQDAETVIVQRSVSFSPPPPPPPRRRPLLQQFPREAFNEVLFLGTRKIFISLTVCHFRKSQEIDLTSNKSKAIFSPFFIANRFLSHSSSSSCRFATPVKI